MSRVSTNLAGNDLVFSMKRNSAAVTDIQSKMGTGIRIKNLRDAPIAAAHSTRFKSLMTRLDRYNKNIDAIQGRYNLAEGYMQESLDILQSLRETAVQGANGTYNKDDLSQMGRQVDEFLKQLVAVGNAKDQNGNALFGGNKLHSTAFQITEGRIAGLKNASIMDIRYMGAQAQNRGDINRVGSSMPTYFQGNEVFWAENQEIYSSADTNGFQVKGDTVIRIDGQPIELRAGDNIQSVISKINGSGAPVKASLDPGNRGLVLKTTVPHQLWLEEAPGSRVLRDLGITDGQTPPNNISPEAVKSGGSLFETVIRMRDALMNGDRESVGGRILAGLDSSIKNLLTNITETGARGKRLAVLKTAQEDEHLEIQEQDARAVDLDMAKAVSDLKMLEYVQKASFLTASKVLQVRLMDFLR